MKTSAVLVAAVAALASAQAPPEGTNKVSCAKPNANYCYGGNIIIRCDANSVGTAANCADNLSGYPPLGGVAECYQSSEFAGDAACQKNCVVYAQPSFTLAASVCTPSVSVTASATASATASSAASSTAAASTEPPAGTSYTTIVSGTETITVPCSTSSAAPVPTWTTTASAAPVPSTNGTVPIGSAPAGSGSGSGPGPVGTNTPVGPTTTGSSPTVPTSGATRVGAGFLAAAGVFAAYLL